MGPPDDIVARLMRLDSCAVSDALDKLGLDGCVTGLSPLCSTRKIAGRIHTARLVAKDKAPPASGPPRHLGTTAIESCQPGDIIVVEQKSGIDAGSWGGILSLGAKLRGVAGVVVDGPVRDIDEARQMDFPVFGRAATARTARNRIVEVGTDIPVSIGDLTVHPGDYVVADGSAVVFLAQNDAARILDAAESIAAREAAMARALHSGKPITEVMGTDYEHMLK
ncbi:MAG: RraA family protein [Xanthobacteraceae bacterium]|nr:RraA family protein [Xanthobacteraceae bacterium]